MRRPESHTPGGEPVESVWDYPRPPRVEPAGARARVDFAGAVIADSERALRVLETSQAPAIYFPPQDVAEELLEPTGRHSLCEWKGRAEYVDVVVGERRGVAAGWRYPRPVASYAELAGYLSFYPQRVDACRLGDELVEPNEGDFYGGWITSGIRGPFKGGPGTAGW
jgi:uncharacterized protein (DUF427 family)